VIRKSFIKHLTLLNGRFLPGLKSNLRYQTLAQRPGLSQKQTVPVFRHNQDSNLIWIWLILSQNRKDFRLGQRGFTLIEVLGSIGIVVIISFAAASAMRGLNLSVNTASRNLEFNALISEITMYITHPDNCVLFMKDMVVTVPAVPTPYQFPSEDTIKMSKIQFRDSTLADIGVKKNGIRVDRAEFDQVVRNNLPPVGANQRYILNFTFSATKTGDLYGAKSKTKKWLILLEVDPAGKIAKCMDAAASEEAKCILQGKTYELARFPFCQ
jgi:prepilin-type N-terminal cleavage/methylation domain-containing protein